MTRRSFTTLAAAAPFAFATASAAPRTSVGVASESFHYRASVERRRGETPITDPLLLAQHCAAMGAGGIQAALPSNDYRDAGKLKSFLQKNGMYFEASVQLPRSEVDLDVFNKSLRAADQAGASVIRTALFTGSRYESFSDVDHYNSARAQAWKSVTLAEPMLRKRKMKMAIENNKDLRSPDILELIDRIQSEYVGVCVDLGNSYALMEDPVDIARAFAKFAFSCHIKDQILKSSEHGFQLFDAPLGTGVVQLGRAISALKQYQPGLRLNLETMTRDAIEVPYLEDEYWVTMDDLPGIDLIRTLRTVRDNEPDEPLPLISQLSPEARIQLEDDNVSTGLNYAANTLGL